MPGLFLGPLCARKGGRERLLCGGQGSGAPLSDPRCGQSLLPCSNDRRIINRDQAHETMGVAWIRT